MSDYSRYIIPTQQWTMPLANAEIESLRTQLEEIKRTWLSPEVYEALLQERQETLKQLAECQQERDMWKETAIRDATRVDELAAQLAAVTKQRDELVVLVKRSLEYRQGNPAYEAALAKLKEDV